MSDAPPSPAGPRPAPSDAAPPGDGQERRERDDGNAASHDLPYREELRRKALHLLALVLPLGVAWLGRTPALWLLVPGAVLALTCDVLRSRSQAFARRIERIFGSMMRADEWGPEREGPTGGLLDVRVNGATWTLVTMALLTLLFPVPVAVAAFSLFMIGDAAAALVGRRFGRTLWGEGPRTVEGTAAFVAAAGLVVALLAGTGYLAVPWWAAALTAVVAAGAEAVPRPLNDNLRVPIVAALLLHFFS